MHDRGAAHQQRREQAEDTNHGGQGAHGGALADAGGDPAGADGGHDAHEAPQHLYGEHFGGGLAALEGDPGEREDGHHMEQRITGQGGEGADENIVAFLAYHLAGADGFQLTFLHGFGVFLTQHQAQARKQGDHVDGERHEERVTPAPAQEVRGAQAVIEIQEQGAGDHKAQRRAQLADHGVPAAAFLGGVQGEEGREAVPGAAERDALHDPEQGE